ncbi:MAG: hypothetical protein A2341_07440 [Deltaproteobacteria bacterium RIFOXYB12_FULL_58_9]|nr:MAG: hypothetical protein A2341_07440 [Deltaproteobacteria bacterium RIFOXYB12_FULL_58_9]
MKAAKKRGHTPGTHFGDVKLVNIELMPILDQQRLLDWQRALWLWIPIAASPGVYSFACGKLPLAPSLLAVAMGLSAAAVLAIVISRSAARFGVGFVSLCRSPWGARGASIVATVRWCVGVIWMAAWASEIGTSTGWLVVRGCPGVESLRGIVGSHIIPWLVAGSVVVSAWWVARGGLSRVGASARLGVTAVVVGLFALVVMGGMASKGFGPWLRRDASWGSSDVAAAAAVALLFSLVGLVACGDWERFRQQPGGRNKLTVLRKAAGIAAPLAMVVFGVLVAFSGALLASAAQTTGGDVSRGLVNHVATFGGNGLAVAAGLVAVALWISVAPLVGVYSSAMAVCGVRPRQFTYRRAALLTVVATLALVPLWRLIEDAGVTIVDVATLLAPPLGVLVVDELLVRRGRVLLDDLFTFSRFYGPLFGFGVAGTFALVAGWLFHPRVVEWAGWRFDGDLHDFVGNPLSGMAVAALVFMVLGSLERVLVWQWLHRAKKVRRRAPEPSILADVSTAGVTDPRYVGKELDAFVVGPVAENPRTSNSEVPALNRPEVKKPKSDSKPRVPRVPRGEVGVDAKAMADDEWWSGEK